MTNISDDLLSLELGEGWLELPAAGADVDEAIAGIVDAVQPESDESRRQLRGGLAAVIRLAHGLAPGSRISHAFIPSRATGQVQALLSIRLSRITPDAHDNYLAAARAYAGDASVEVVNRVVEEVVLPAGPGVLSRDFTLPVEREGVPDPVLERCFLALFPEGYEVAVEFTLLTHNLALFEDAGAYLLAVASGETVGVSGEVRS